ncbi:hypothetical protein FBZ89_109210 [Nitrospirillum amazonense]|uniref:Uncharacterized protein n=1 Tax=Nitrospirillum amazonense TaxID=28077 RepID=A0A560FB41_9PROT|nr:hypothetical protein [Nitrospirillum amazonense]TWB18824.1 hypothetical protein FBZ89_109210 [Nitrospirillum amazonense]
MIAFLDIEASSLDSGSYPIEVGWAIPGRQIESYLILPHPDWTDWDPAAQGVHGLSRQTLFSDGTAGPAVLARLSRSLVGLTVYSDAPAEDGYWLGRLCQACGQPQPFLLHDAEMLFQEMAAAAGRDLEAARLEVGHQFPIRHRAAPDVAYLSALWTRLGSGRKAINQRTRLQ